MQKHLATSNQLHLNSNLHLKASIQIFLSLFPTKYINRLLLESKRLHVLQDGESNLILLIVSLSHRQRDSLFFHSSKLKDNLYYCPMQFVCKLNFLKFYQNSEYRLHQSKRIISILTALKGIQVEGSVFLFVYISISTDDKRGDNQRSRISSMDLVLSLKVQSNWGLYLAFQTSKYTFCSKDISTFALIPISSLLCIIIHYNLLLSQYQYPSNLVFDTALILSVQVYSGNRVNLELSEACQADQLYPQVQ